MLKRLLRLLKDSVIYGTGSLLNQLISFLLLPLYTRLLSPTDYGVANMLALVPLVFVTLATSGMKSAVFQRFNRYPDDAARAQMISTGQLSVLGGALVIGAVALVGTRLIARVLFGAELALLEVQLTIATAAVAALSEVPRAVLQSQKRAREVSALSVVQFFTTTSVTVALVAGLRIGVMGLVIGGLAGQLVGTVACLWLTRAALRPTFSVPEWRAMSTYGRPYLPHRLMGVILTVFADWIVRERLGLHEAGLYGLASRFAVPVAFVTTALLQAWQPYKYQVLHEDSADRGFFASIFTYFVAVFGWFWIGLSAWGPELLRLMAAPEFHTGATLVWILVLMRILQGAYPMLATGVDVGDNTRWVPLASFAATVVMVPATLFASATWGAAGAALGGSLGWLVMAIAFYFISQRVFPIPYDLKAVFTLIAVATACVAGTVISQRLAIWPRLAVALLLSVSFPAVVLFVFGRSPAERARIQKLVSDVKLRLSRRAALKSPG